MNPTGERELTVNVVELNPYAPRPFVFSEAARSLRDSIQHAGWQSIVSGNRADVSSINVVLGAIPPHWSALDAFDPARTIIFNFEQLGSSSPLVGPEYMHWLRGWTVADYHSHNVEYLRQRNGPGQRAFELPLVPTHSLRWPDGVNVEKTVDVLFYGTPGDRRTAVIRRLEAAGLTVEAVAGAYAEELAPAVRRARVVLHVHQYETGLFPVLRVLQPVANGVPVVCESSRFSALSDWSASGIVFAEYDDLANTCVDLVRSPSRQAESARRSLEFTSRLDFTAAFNEMLKAQLRVLAGPALPLSVGTAKPRAEETHELSDAEIEAILEREATRLPPEAHLPAQPIPIVERQLGQPGMGRWAAWLLLAFTLAMLWQSLR